MMFKRFMQYLMNSVKPVELSREDVIDIAREAGFKASVGKTDKEGKYHPYVNALSKDVPVEWIEKVIKLAAAKGAQ